MSRARSLLCALAVAWCVSPGGAAGTDPKGPPALKLSPSEKELLELTNQARKKADLPPLKPDPVLFAVARAHSANMAKKGQMKHVLDGKDVDNRLDDAGYDFASAGENIGTARKAPLAAVMKGWMESKGHRENILKPKFEEIGIGIVEDGKGTTYYTQVFGRRRKE
jgi:uncharacterized protein YkwD